MGTMVPLPATAGNPVAAVAVSDDRVAALCDGTVYLGTLVGGLAALCEGSVNVAFHGSHLYTGRENSVVVVDADSGRELATIGPAETPLQGFAVMDRHVALGEYREVSIWAGERCVARRRLHDGTVPHLAFAPTGDELVTRRNDEFAIWPWRSRWARLRRVRAGEGYGSGFAFLPDGRMIGALGRDRLGIWSAPGRREDSLQTDDWVRSVCAAPDGGRIAARLSGGGVLVWSLPEGERIGEHEASLLARGIAFSPDGSTLITGDDAALMTWGGGVPEPDPAVFAPTFPARFAARPATPLLAAVESIPWLAGADLDAWPGPEDADVSALNRYEVELAAPVERAIRGLHRDEVRAHAEEIGARVRASTTVTYDPDEDPWHPPTAAVDTAVYVAETLAGYVGLGWPVPDDLQTLWAWYVAGRWPGAISDGALVVY